MPQPATRWRSIGTAATVLIVAQLVIRGWLAARGSFYWDDLILIGRSTDHPILSWDYLGHGHDGHFMPAAFLVAGLSTLIAPVQWWLPAITLVVLQAVASVAVWRMIRVVAPQARLGALTALAFYLFSPMTVGTYLWWAAALNTLPMQAGLAIVVANAVLLIREPERSPASRRRLVVGAAMAFLVALAFFEKSLFIAPVAAAAALLATRGVSPKGSARTLWWSLAGIFAAWTVLVLGVARTVDTAGSVGQTLTLAWRSIDDALVPSLVGGPWTWSRWLPSPPMGEPALWMIVAGYLLIVGVVGWTSYTRRGAGWIWAGAALYAVGAQLPVMWIRSSDQTALELGQTMRYLPDTALVIALAIALVAGRPRRTAGLASATVRRPLAVAGIAALIVSSCVSTAAYLTSWRESPTGPYLAQGRDALRTHPDAVLFDQAVPLEVLTPMVYPYNRTSRIFGRVRDRAAFADQTEELTVLDEDGRAVPGGVSPQRTVEAGAGSCRRPVDGRLTAELSDRVMDWEWTVGISYCATVDGEIGVSLGSGPQRRVRVRQGLHPLYFQLSGAGDRLNIETLTPGLRVHTGTGRLGEPIVAEYAP